MPKQWAGRPRQDCACNGSGKVGLHSLRSLCEESRVLTAPSQGCICREGFPSLHSWESVTPTSLNHCSPVGRAKPSVPSCAAEVSLLPGLGVLIPSASPGPLPFPIIWSRWQPDENQGWEAFNAACWNCAVTCVSQSQARAPTSTAWDWPGAAGTSTVARGQHQLEQRWALLLPTSRTEILLFLRGWHGFKSQCPG